MTMMPEALAWLDHAASAVTVASFPLVIVGLMALFASHSLARRIVGWSLLGLAFLAYLVDVSDRLGLLKTSIPSYSAEWLASRQNTFKSGALSIINASGNMPATEIRTVSEPESGRFANILTDFFLTSSLRTYIDPQGHRVGVPATRLDPGINIVAPVPSLAAEAIRVGLERIGIQTRRAKADGDYIIVEVGAAP
jgi:hypothetical protein